MTSALVAIRDVLRDGLKRLVDPRPRIAQRLHSDTAYRRDLGERGVSQRFNHHKNLPKSTEAIGPPYSHGVINVARPLQVLKDLSGEVVTMAINKVVLA
jgi:hypothetical protein